VATERLSGLRAVSEAVDWRHRIKPSVEQGVVGERGGNFVNIEQR
jgi:hypothetical protein